MKLEMFPLLTISFVIYLALTLILPEQSGAAWYQWEIARLPLYSKDEWSIRWGDLFLVMSMALLFIELVRATKSGKESITNHLLSFLLFIAVLLCFILAPGFGNSIFFIYLTMTLLDPMAGMVVTTQSARRDLNVSDTKALLG
jgi:membrane-associated HD superfamily phosphohydrolase